MSQVQSGILPEHCRAAIWIEANVKGDVDALRAASKTFADTPPTIEAKFPNAHPLKPLPINCQPSQHNSRTLISALWWPLVSTPGVL